MAKKRFPASVVITAATGRLTCDMGQVYEILNFLTNDDLMTHQLPRAFRECEPWLMHRHEECRLAQSRESELDELLKTMEPKAACAEWLRSLGLPDEIEVESIPIDDHTRIDPVTEAVGMFGKDGVVVMEVGDMD